MRISSLTTGISALLALAACSDDGLGATCKPIVPCDANGKNCGFSTAETYVQEDAPGCPPSQACIVFHLDNGTQGTLPADPNVPCTSANSPAGCVDSSSLEKSLYCSCACRRANPNDSRDLCTCGEGYACTQLTVGDSYCVKTSAL